MDGTDRQFPRGLKDGPKNQQFGRFSQAFGAGPKNKRTASGGPSRVRPRLLFSALINEICCLAGRLRLKAPHQPKDRAMAHNYAINDDVLHQMQGPQGRAVVKQPSVYTIVTCLPIEADGRPRYRIKSKTENVERVVTEEQISRLG
jgi:hypothetical protein